jgi:hypothetical protein
LHPVQRNTFSVRPLGQVGIQQLLSVHFHDPHIGKDKVRARRHTPTGGSPTILLYRPRACSRSSPSSIARRLVRHDC